MCYKLHRGIEHTKCFILVYYVSPESQVKVIKSEKITLLQCTMFLIGTSFDLEECNNCYFILSSNEHKKTYNIPKCLSQHSPLTC